MDSKLILILVMCVQPGFQGYARLYAKNQRKCVNLLREPNYSEPKVIGNLWREYYSWNQMPKNCTITQFSKPTSRTIRRFENNMSDYVKTKLEWTEATMLAKSKKHQMLMFDDEGPPGSYQGLLDITQYGDVNGFAAHEVEPMKFAMKLVRGDKFLIMLDCMGGLGHIMVKTNDTVTEDEIHSVAKEVGMGKGYIGCVYFITSTTTFSSDTGSVDS